MNLKILILKRVEKVLIDVKENGRGYTKQRVVKVTLNQQRTEMRALPTKMLNAKARVPKARVLKARALKA